MLNILHPPPRHTHVYYISNQMRYATGYATEYATEYATGKREYATGYATGSMPLGIFSMSLEEFCSQWSQAPRPPGHFRMRTPRKHQKHNWCCFFLLRHSGWPAKLLIAPTIPWCTSPQIFTSTASKVSRIVISWVRFRAQPCGLTEQTELNSFIKRSRCENQMAFSRAELRGG